MPTSNAPPPKFLVLARTHVSRSQLLAEYARTFAEAAGQWPTKQALSVLWGMWAHETGRGQFFWWFNVGNMRGVSPQGLYTVFDKAWEIVDGKRVITGGKFRAYTTLYDGCEDFVRHLASQFVMAWDVLLSAAPTAYAFIHALKAQKYFTGDVDEYVVSVTSLAAECFQGATTLDEWPIMNPLKYKQEPGLTLGNSTLSPYEIHTVETEHTPLGMEPSDPAPTHLSSSELEAVPDSVRLDVPRTIDRDRKTPSDRPSKMPNS